MTSQHDTPKRWRPRFSVRTLIVVVTLVCRYAACWGPTKISGEQDVYFHVNEKWNWPSTAVDSSRRWPLLVYVVRIVRPSEVQRSEVRGGYYFWFFGYVAQLPFEWEL